jgi:hypothetical protein
MPFELETLEKFPAGDNPFWHDAFHMGTFIGNNVLVMHKNFEHEHADYIILCNIETGERLRIKL